MSFLDWAIVIGLNGGIIGYGLYLARGVRSSTDWFLAGRSLPWWIVGLSMYATAIDASDLIADSGGTYTIGFRYFVSNMVGIVAGWALAAYFIFLPMYRAGMYTNAEYLETRFGPSARVLCALIQVQYRTLVMGVMGVSLFWTLSVICGWDQTRAMAAVGAIAIFASIYTAFGGLRSVAISDVLQFVVMTVAALLIWFIVLDQVGGWSGVEERLSGDPELSQLLHAGSDLPSIEDVSAKTPQEIDHALLLGGEYSPEKGTITRTTPNWLLALGFLILGIGYSVVNHTQSMRMFASRTEWDLKMSVVVASLVMIVMSFFNLSMGVLGRALVPDQASLPGGNQDQIYPFLVSQIEAVGLKGIVVAGIFAASFSTYDSISSSLSALLTRDVYARLFVPDRDDHHYLRVGQWLTPVVIGISFLYVPFLLEGGMLLQFFALTSAFVTPLLTLFIMGRFTRVHRISGTVGLLVGAGFGILRLLALPIAESWGMAVLPSSLIDPYAAYPAAMLITAAAMMLTSLLLGFEPRAEAPPSSHQERGGAWLRSSREAIQVLAATQGQTPGTSQGAARFAPAALVWLLLALGCYICFVLLW